MTDPQTVTSTPAQSTPAQSTPAPATPARSGVRQMLPSMSGKLLAGLILVGAIVLFAVVGPWITQDPRSSGNDAMLPPQPGHWLGTTSLGYDVLAQLAEGARGSLIVGVTAGLVAIVLALFFGVVAGYVRGWTDEVLSLITGIMLVIPGLPLMIVVASYLQVRSLWVVALILGITAFAGPAVVLRSQARSLRVRDYVAAARVAGEKTPRVILVEVLPNLLPLLAAQFLFAIVLAILGEAGLSYLGLGPNGSITWGTMLNEAQGGGALTRGAWWWFVPPGLMIALFGTGLSLINFAIDEIVNPKLRLAPAAAKSVREARKAGKDKLGRAAAARAAQVGQADQADEADQKERVDV